MSSRVRFVFYARLSICLRFGRSRETLFDIFYDIVIMQRKKKQLLIVTTTIQNIMQYLPVLCISPGSVGRKLNRRTIILVSIRCRFNKKNKIHRIYYLIVIILVKFTYYINRYLSFNLCKYIMYS